MSSKTPALFLATTVALAGCAAAPPRPMRFVAVDAPNAISSPPAGAAHKVEVSKTVVLPNIRLPEDVAAFLKELHEKAQTPVLRNADLRLTTSVCLFICINTDTATADGY